MVVGYEKVGKTSLLECLFPFKIQNISFNSKSVTLEVSGKHIRIYDESDTPPAKAIKLNQGDWQYCTSPSKTIILDQGKWKVTEIQPNKIQINQEDGPQEQLLFEIPNQEEKQTILKRIQRITGIQEPTE